MTAQGWYPIARSDDLPPRHVYRTELLGRELVAWRADDGFVNVWQNRCLHRGVRLSIGTNDGRELICRYHGWRYANRTGGCTYIPAHPADAPARTICNRTFPAVERYGLVWTREEPDGELPPVPALDAQGAFGLRNLPVDAPAALVAERLAAEPDLGVLEGAEIMSFVQPVDADRCVVRPVMVGAPADRNRVLRRHNALLSAWRDLVEADAAARPTPEPVPEVPVVAGPVVEPTSSPSPGRTAPLRVTVARKWDSADGIAAFELAPIEGQLPTFQPGAHVDVHLPNGLVRQYSLTNGPGELAWYRIGVKREPESRGGSESLHDEVREGDVLALSEPRNNFPLRRDALRTVLVAGGIGVTPLLSMAQALHHGGLGFELHYFARDESQVAFREVLDRLGESVHLHLGLDPAGTQAAIESLLARPAEAEVIAEHLYVCGPGPMLDATRRIATERGWPDTHVHFEYFANPTEIDDSTSFTIELARSARTLSVDAGRTILEELRDAGVLLPSSCEQGACGTCEVAILDGEPVHHDVYLTDREKAAGDRLMACVSRAAGERLVLDL